MRALMSGGLVLFTALALCACPPPEDEEDAGGGDRDAGVADTAQPDMTTADVERVDTSQPDAAAPDSAVPDAWCPEAGAAPLTEQARVTGLASSTSASNGWAFPLQHGLAVCGDEVARLEGYEIVFYDRTALAAGNATQLQRLYLGASGGEDGGAAIAYSGIGLAFDPSTCDRLFFTYGKPDYTGGIGYVERGASIWNDPVLDAGALMTSTFFPVVPITIDPPAEDAGSGAPETTFVVVDDMMGHVRRLKSYGAGGGLVEDEAMTLAGCSGQPANLYLDAPYALHGPYVAVAYTGSFFTEDEGKGGFFVFDVRDPGASACKGHVALPAGAETDSHVAVGGMAVRDAMDVVVAWDHYGAGYPAPRYDSKLLVYQLVAGPMVVAATPDAEAALSARWPSAVFYIGGGETVVVEAPPSCAFTVELFDQGLASLGKVHGPDATTYTQYYRSVAFGSTGVAPTSPFWLSQPDALVLYSRP